MVYANGSIYDGQWTRGRWNGRGVLVDTDGVRVEGVWKRGLFQEQFSRVKSVDAVESTSQGTMDGIVTITVAHNTYVGEVNAEGQMHGHGRLEYRNGNLYTGEFMNDKRHGQGTLQQVHDVGTSTGLVCGGTYTGQWVNDKKQGQAVFVGTDGERFEGRFLDGKRHGPGTTTHADGTVETGKWVRGRLASSCGPSFDAQFDGEADSVVVSDFSVSVPAAAVIEQQPVIVPVEPLHLPTNTDKVDPLVTQFIRKTFGGEPFFGLVVGYAEPFYTVRFDLCLLFVIVFF
jgi:hypothetical protein